jgi:hypothetical protein
VVGVAHEVVHPVYVEFASDQLAEFAFARHEVGDELGVETVGFEYRDESARREQVADLVVVAAESALDDSLCLVAVRAVTHVVEQGGRPDSFRSALLDSEEVGRLPGEVVDAEAVFESGVVRRGVDQSDRTQLLDVAESLDRGRVEEVRGEVADRDVVVNAVLDGLHIERFSGRGKNGPSPALVRPRSPARPVRRSTEKAPTESPR